MTEPPLNLDQGFTVSVYFPPGSDPDWVSEFLSRVATDAYGMPSDTLDAFVVGHAGDVLGIDGPEDESEADVDAAMAAGTLVELINLPEPTSEDAVEAMQDMATDLYKAEDRLAFVREMCDLADREQRQVTTEQVRAWTQYTGCGGVLQLTDQQAETLAADLNAGRVKSRKARIIELRETDEHPAGIAIPTAGEEL